MKQMLFFVNKRTTKNAKHVTRYKQGTTRCLRHMLINYNLQVKVESDWQLNVFHIANF